ncbi:class I SAM-dependent methyltransferase [Legionella fairfieldensis]|uniref:class I SAM-dependent methyltransferase n=1 Tax=Legionella fairfieldensis TaxID=45064 RepID=UPI000688A34C|nr:methyltransferase domain-containing protein [Legionella fairfieldensis]
MSLNAEKSKFRALDNWFNSPQGIDVGDAFTTELSHLNEFLYGETLLQLGHCSTNPWLRPLHYSHKWCATPYTDPLSTLVTSFNYLPLARNSVDCIIAPLTMEAFNYKKNPIDELDRVLKPMGYVVFLGINPMSLWGLFVRLKRYSCFGPLKGQPMSVFFIKRAMLHRGYIQCNLSAFYYIPPVSTEKWVRNLHILNELGKMISPCPAGFYCLVMQKEEEAHPDILSGAIKAKQWEREGALQPTYQSDTTVFEQSW